MVRVDKRKLTLGREEGRNGYDPKCQGKANYIEVTRKERDV